MIWKAVFIVWISALYFLLRKAWLRADIVLMFSIPSHIRSVLEKAIHAPSGENCQPWRFEIGADDTIHVFNIPERDSSLYSWGQRASYFAHGALLENIRIAAEGSGFKTELELLPDPRNSSYVARVRLTAAQSVLEARSLVPFILERATNRKPYTVSELSAVGEETLVNEAELYAPAKIYFLKDRVSIRALSAAASVNERVLFENKKLHDFFYDHITWTREEDERKRLGFYIKTFELPLPAERMFQLCKNYTYARVLRAVGLPRFIARQNASVYASCAAVGVITIPSLASEEFIRAGMLFERIWLRAARETLSIQPLAGMIYLALRIFAREASDFSLSQQKQIQEAYSTVRRIAGNKNAYIPMMFRIGKSDPPSARALRLVPDITMRNF